MITLQEGNNELNIQMAPVAAAEFVYTSDLGLEYISGTYDVKWTVSVQNIGSGPGDLHLIVGQRMKAPYTTLIMWSGFNTYFDKVETFAAGQEKTYSGVIQRGPYTYQVMAKSEAGTLLNPPQPLEYICDCCANKGQLVSFATQEALSAHYASAHPEYAAMPPLTAFTLEGLSWPDHFLHQSWVNPDREDMGRITEWRAVCLLDESDYDPSAGWRREHLPTTGNALVPVTQALQFVMPAGWQGAEQGDCGKIPNSTILRLHFKTDLGWTGWLGDSPWLRRIPDLANITFQVSETGPGNWSWS